MMDASTLWSSLSKSVEDEDFTSALETLKNFFDTDKESRRNPSLLHCKVYCLIQSGDFNSAVQLINSLKSSQPDLFATLRFEHGYSLYKLNQFGKSLGVVNQYRQRLSNQQQRQSYVQLPINWNSEEDQKFALLEAQVLYRLGLYKESTALYEQFYEQDPDDHLVAVNLQASRACLGESSDSDANEELAMTSHEAAFNSACLAIEEGKLKEARQLVESAEDQWRNGEEQDPSDYRTIEAQRAYLDLLENKSNDALQAYKDTLCAPNDEMDPTLPIVARNNLATINNEPSELPTVPGVPIWFLRNCSRHSSSEESSIKFSQMTSGYRCGVSLRLTRQQLLPIIINTAYGMLKTNRLRECRRYLDGFNEASSFAAVSQLKAQLEIAENKSEAAINQLIKAAKSSSSDALRSEFLISALIISVQSNHSQLLHLISNTMTASSLINSGLDSDTLSLVLRLLQTANHKRFTTLVDEMKSQLSSMSDSKELFSPLNALAEAELHSGNFQSAYQLFNRMGQLGKDPIRSTIGRLRSSTGFDFTIAKKTMNELKSQKKDLFTNQALTLIDPDDVAAMPISLDRRSIRTTTELLKLFSSSRAFGSAVEEIQKANGYNLQGVKTKKHRKRKPRYPKNFDPKNPGALPDPERWLPKYERTTFKKTKRGNIKTFRGAQGLSNTAAGEIGTGKKTATTANVEIKKETGRRSGRRARH